MTSLSQQTKRQIVVAVLSFVVVMVDQLTKALAPHFDHWDFVSPVRNSDMALNIVGGPTTIEVLLATAGLATFGGYLVWRVHRGSTYPVTAALIIGGAVGNLVDRLRLGEVVDFLVTPWAIINFADLALVAGIVLHIATWARRQFSAPRGRHLA